MEIQLNRNDILFVFTDGAYEVFDDNNNMFGDEHLKRIFSKNVKNNVSDIKEKIINEIKSFTKEPLKDDVSMILLKRTT